MLHGGPKKVEHDTLHQWWTGEQPSSRQGEQVMVLGQISEINAKTIPKAPNHSPGLERTFSQSARIVPHQTQSPQVASAATRPSCHPNGPKYPKTSPTPFSINIDRKNTPVGAKGSAERLHSSGIEPEPAAHWVRVRNEVEGSNPNH